METALARLKKHWEAEDYRAALKLAASWPQLGPQRGPIKTGWAALLSPGMYREMGQDPAELVGVGVAAVATRYGLAVQPGALAAVVGEVAHAQAH
jgi:hypothetical protein